MTDESVRFRQGKETISSLPPFSLALGPSQQPAQWVPGIKRPGSEQNFICHPVLTLYRTLPPPPLATLHQGTCSRAGTSLPLFSTGYQARYKA
jgi:hypothetical protein